MLVNGELANKQKGARCVLHTTAFNSILRGKRTKHFKCNTSAHLVLGSMHTGSIWEPCLLPILEANLFPSFVIASRVLLDDVLSGTVETRKLIWSNMYRVTGIGVGNERTMLLEPFHLYSLQIQPLPLVHSHIPRDFPNGSLPAASYTLLNLPMPTMISSLPQVASFLNAGILKVVRCAESSEISV